MLATVLLYDIGQSWDLIADWAGLQGYYDGLPLPAWIGLSDEATLRVVFAVYGLFAIGLLAGYKTTWCTVAVWVTSCAHHYAARHTIDYHDTAIVNLLLWSLALPLGQRLSVDAALRRKAGRAVPPLQYHPTQVVAGCGFVLTLAWLYLNTAVCKDGSAWWWEGNAVRLAAMEFAARSPTGVWAVAHLPDACFRAATHIVMAVEWLVPVLLLIPWRRFALRLASALVLVFMHGAMWLLMDIGSFPPTMMAAACALLPTTFWNRLAGGSAAPRPPAAARPACRRRLRQHLLNGFFGLSVLINIEGTRLQALDPDERCPYPGAEWVLKLKYLLGVESTWAMYAPEPAGYGGWWVALGRRSSGTEVDLITGEPPTLTPPFPRRGPHASLRGHYWSQAPYEGGPQNTYLRFLLWRNQRAPAHEHVVELRLIYVYERYERSSATDNGPGQAYPLSILRWPQHERDGRAAWMLYRADLNRLGDSDWQPARLERERSSP